MCSTISQHLILIRRAKRKFDDAVSRALKSNNVTEALGQKAELEAALRPAFEMVFPCESPELSIITINEAVRHYRSLYESTGVINASGESVLRLPGEDTDRHYPMPTEAQVVDYLRSQTNHETIKHLLELGLVKLAIIPLSGFGNADTINAINAGQYNDPTVPPLVRAVGNKLRQKFNAQELTLADGTIVGETELNRQSLVWIDDTYANLTYRHGTKPDPNDATKTVSDWKTAGELLDPAVTTTPFPGWTITLVPTDPTLIRQYPDTSPLTPLNANQRVNAYEAKLNSIPGLTGWTPEMELLAYLERLNLSGPIPVLRDWQNPTDGANILLGTTFNGGPMGSRPFAYWGRAVGQLSFRWFGPDSRISNLGALPAATL